MIDGVQSDTIQDELLSFLVSSPSPEQIIAFRASDSAQDRLHYLMTRCAEQTLTEDEQAEMDEVSQTNHLLVMLKAKAQQALETA